MKGIWVELVTSLVRHLMTAVVGLLVAKGLIDADRAGHFTGELTASIVGGLLLFVGTYGASIWSKIKARNLFVAALNAEPTTPAKEVIAEADSKSVAEKIATATAVIPEKETP